MYQRHQHLRVIKRLFILLSCVLVLAIFIWPNFVARAALPIGNISLIENTATSIQYKSFDSKGQAFTLLSSRGKEISADNVELINPKLLLTQHDGSTVYVSAHKGLLNRSSHVIMVSDDVHTIYSKGYQLRSKKAIIKLSHVPHIEK